MRFLILMLFLLFPISVSGSPLIVIYPKEQSSNDTRRAEVIELIAIALKKTEATHGPFILRPSDYTANQLRQVSEIKMNRSGRINLAWLDTNEKIEDELFPVYIPIQKGIVGYRVFLIKSDSIDKFTKDMTFGELQKLTNGIGPGWMDEGVFELNRLSYVKGSNYEGLFRMLSRERFDYFSRGINEAFIELKDRKHLYQDMRVEENIALYYRHPIYLFTSKQNINLHERLETGLNIMIDDGSFNRIFCKHNRASIGLSNIKNRKIFELKYHLKIPKHVIERKELWFDPMVDSCQ